MICPNCQREITESSNFCYLCGARQTAPAAAPAGPRPLVRPVHGRVFGGVLAGFGEHLGLDVSLLRVMYAIVTVFTGIFPGIIAYIIAWIIMPDGAGVRVSHVPTRRLYRSVADRKLGGVCAGIGEFVGLDPALVRLLWVVLSVFPGAILGGFLVYVICWILIPEAPAMLPAAHSAPAAQHS